MITYIPHTETRLPDGNYACASFLWQMMEEALTEPNTTISHQHMPTWEEHLTFLASNARRVLLIISDARREPGDKSVGFVTLTNNNEIGIRLRKDCRGRGYGTKALEHILERYEPLPAVPSVRPGRFVANINPANAASIALFTKLGFRQIQSTFAL